MLIGEAQFLAIVFYAVCLYHSWQTEGRRHAQQWFAVGYIFALLRERLLVQLGAILYSDQALNLDGTPTLLSLFIPSIFYVSYFAVRRLADLETPQLPCYIIFLLTPALMLPLDATGARFGWWLYPSGSQVFLGGVPYFVPLSWGLTAALFYLVVWRVRRIRLRGSGQLFALIISAPLLVGVDLLLVALAQLLSDVLGLVSGNLLENTVLVILFLGLPLGVLVGRPALAKSG